MDENTQFEKDKPPFTERIRAKLVILFEGKHDDLLEHLDRLRRSQTRSFYPVAPEGTEEEKVEYLREFWTKFFKDRKNENENEKFGYTQHKILDPVEGSEGTTTYKADAQAEKLAH
jgi:hypothetical protein